MVNITVFAAYMAASRSVFAVLQISLQYVNVISREHG